MKKTCKNVKTPKRYEQGRGSTDRVGYVGPKIKQTTFI